MLLKCVSLIYALSFSVRTDKLPFNSRVFEDGITYEVTVNNLAGSGEYVHYNFVELNNEEGKTLTLPLKCEKL